MGGDHDAGAALVPAGQQRGWRCCLTACRVGPAGRVLARSQRRRRGGVPGPCMTPPPSPPLPPAPAHLQLLDWMEAPTNNMPAFMARYKCDK